MFKKLEMAGRAARAVLPKDMGCVFVVFELDGAQGYIGSEYDNEFTIARLEEAIERLKKGPPDLPRGSAMGGDS